MGFPKGVLNVTSPGKARVYLGTMADLLLANQVYQPYQIVKVLDSPGTVFFGDGVTPFKDLAAVGKVNTPIASPINTTAAGTSAVVLAGIKSGLITSANTAAQTLTLPTAAILAAAFKAKKGMSLQFTVDNSGTAIVTVAVAAGITVAPAIVTGSDTLTVAVGAVAVFRIYFKTVTTALLSRVQ